MRTLAFVVGAFTLLAAAPAAAQISNIQFTAGSSYQVPGTVCSSAPCTRTITLPGGQGQIPPAAPDTNPTAGSSYNSYVDVGGAAIIFESSNATSQGPYQLFSSYSTLSFDFNATSETNFRSEIIPQGLGMYLADTSDGCVFTNSCVQISDQIHTFGDLSPLGSGATGILGAAGFEFQILDNGNPLYTLSGLLALEANPDYANGFRYIQTLTTPVGESPADQLDGFRQQTHAFDLSARAYAWDATQIGFLLGEGNHSIEYRTRVFTYANSDCTGPYQTVCLIAYSGFGDPIGRGGAIDALRAPAQFSSLRGFQVGPMTHQDDDLINGLTFSPQTFRLSFNNGELSYAPSAAVPEPATWAIMIFGFGAAGAALRRRRIPAHI